MSNLTILSHDSDSRGLLPGVMTGNSRTSAARGLALLAQATDFHKDGNVEEAERLYKRALDLDEQNADGHHMLGALLIQKYGRDEFDVACQHLRRAIQLDPSQAKYRHSLGVAYESSEKWAKAVDCYQFAIDKDPFNTKFLMSLVKPLMSLKRFTRSVEVCKSVLALDPAHTKANVKCASALRQLRRQPEAILYYRRHLDRFPDDEQARFWVGVLTGADVPRAPACHVASLFDCYANRFERHLLESLHYRTPSVLMDATLAASDQLATPSNSSSPPWSSCLDLGCGTGLMGPLLKGHVNCLTGVDLSAKMIQKAQEKGVYTDLIVDDIESFLQRQRELSSSFNLIVAADVLVYLGDLEPLFSAAAKVAAPGCLLALSTEQYSTSRRDLQGSESEGSNSGQDRGYIATLTGRFQHAKDYVSAVARTAGWSQVSWSEETIRCNAGEAIVGDVFVFWMPER